ncbi:MAG TPA: fumarylacetoacetate hydrolase family protein [Acidimicrobiia bacterium]|nr:fumarylacetoacetate hydrolase family protein [Acidimicrobiia bacterium]
MSPLGQDEETAARALATAWRTGVTTAPPSARLDRFDRAGGYRIQQRVTGLLADDLGDQVGWKIGLTSLASGSPAFHGSLFREMTHETDTMVRLGPSIAPRIEVELALMPGADIDGAIDRDAVAAMPFTATAAFEIVDNRTHPTDDEADWIADMATMHSVVLGPFVDLEVEMGSQVGSLKMSGDRVAEGRVGDVVTDPFLSVALLSGRLSTGERGIRAGDIIITGTLTGQVAVRAGIAYRGELSGVGAVEAVFI